MRHAAGMRGRSLALLCLTSVLFIWPALVNRAPMIYPDTRSYYVGGHIAVEKIAASVERLLHTAQPAGAAGPGQEENALHNARGVRSAYYALFVYVLNAIGSLWLVVLVQAFVTVWACNRAMTLLRPELSIAARLAVLVGVAVLSTAPWSVSLVMPDLFTAVMVLAVAGLIAGWQVLTPRGRLALAAVVCVSLVMHASNLLIAAGLGAVGLLFSLRHAVRAPGRWLALVASGIVALMAMLAVSIVGFHEVTLFPQAPPFLLARSIEDGPARLYLQQHCPQAGFAMCSHLDKIDENAADFLWAPDGLYSSASPQERDRIRAEEKRLVMAAALEHPALQLQASARQFLTQLVLFDLRDYQIGGFATTSATDMQSYQPPDRPAWIWGFVVIQYLAVIASAVALIWFVASGRLTGIERRICWLVTLAVVLDAAVCGGFSAISPRYEARVIWLLPFLALTFAIRRRGRAYQSEDARS